MSRFINLILFGLSYGIIYSAVGLGLVLIHRATRIVNFAQGAMATLSTFIAVTFIDRGYSYWVALGAAIVAGFLVGAVAERVFMRPVEKKSPLNAVIVSLGLLTFIEALTGMIWGAKYRSYPAQFSTKGIKVGASRLAISHFDIFVIVTVLAVMLVLLVLFKYTNVGLKMRASAFSPEVAGMLGVRVGRMLTLGWALAVALGALAGVLVAPNVLLYPNNMDVVNIFGFIAAILGGLDSPAGAVIGGLTLGIAVQLVGGYMGSSFETLAGLVVLVAILLIKPEGIFSSTVGRKV